MPRENYTAAGFKAMKEKLAKAAIDRAVYEMVYKPRGRRSGGPQA